jgi:branched-chain amino acid transport system substrate-binding protein
MVQKLITQNGVSAIIGALTSDVSIPAHRTACQYGIPIISPTSTNPNVTMENGKHLPCSFLATYTDNFQGRVAAIFAYKNLNLRKIGVLYDQGSDYSTGLEESFVKEFTSLGGKVEIVSYTTSDTDFSPYLTKVMSQNIQALFLPDLYNRVNLIVNQAKMLGFKGLFLGGDAWDSDGLNRELLSGSYYVGHNAADDPSLKPFVEKWQKVYNQNPPGVGIGAYDATLVVLNAIKASKSADPAVLIKYIQKTKDLQVVEGKLTMGSDGAAMLPAYVLKVTPEGPRFATKIQP